MGHVFPCVCVCTLSLIPQRWHQWHPCGIHPGCPDRCHGRADRGSAAGHRPQAAGGNRGGQKVSVTELHIHTHYPPLGLTFHPGVGTTRFAHTTCLCLPVSAAAGAPGSPCGSAVMVCRAARWASSDWDASVGLSSFTAAPSPTLLLPYPSPSCLLCKLLAGRRWLQTGFSVPRHGHRPQADAVWSEAAAVRGESGKGLRL